MTENNYEFTLKMPVSWLGIMEAAMEGLIRRRAEDHDDVTDEARILTLLENAGRDVRLREEQTQLETQIKDLEKRRNELRV